MESRQLSVQPNDEKGLEKLMDEHLKANGFYRKKIAKDGSCLFRAVAEQVLHCQGLHTNVRATCVRYLKQNKDMYESFIEGDFEEYLQRLQDPQSWVGQVEISALAVLYKHDFVIYQQPGEPPVNITENGFPDKVRLCFLNGNHYDSVYPESFPKSSAVCQSLLYQLLYERVFGVESSVLATCVKSGRVREGTEAAECRSSEESDLEEEEYFWKDAEGRTNEATNRNPSSTGRPPHRGRGRGHSRGGRGFLSPRVEATLNPSLFRNLEYDVWLSSKRAQQKRDFCMAAGLQYAAGDKCQVRLSNNGRIYKACIKEVHSNNGPVTVYIEELRRGETVPLWNLRSSSENSSWSKVAEKGKRHSTANSNVQGQSEWESRGPRKPSKSSGATPSPSPSPSNRMQKPQWPPAASPEKQTGGKTGTYGRPAEGSNTAGSCPKEDEQALLDLLHKDEENFPSLGAGKQAEDKEQEDDGKKKSGPSHTDRRSSRKGAEQKDSTTEVGSDKKEQHLRTFQKTDGGKQYARKGPYVEDHRVSSSSSSITPSSTPAAAPSEAPAAPVSSETAPLPPPAPVPAPLPEAPQGTPSSSPTLTQTGPPPIVTVPLKTPLETGQMSSHAAPPSLPAAATPPPPLSASPDSPVSSSTPPTANPSASLSSPVAPNAHSAAPPAPLTAPAISFATPDAPVSVAPAQVASLYPLNELGSAPATQPSYATLTPTSPPIVPAPSPQPQPPAPIPHSQTPPVPTPHPQTAPAPPPQITPVPTPVAAPAPFPTPHPDAPSLSAPYSHAPPLIPTHPQAAPPPTMYSHTTPLPSPHPQTAPLHTHPVQPPPAPYPHPQNVPLPQTASVATPHPQSAPLPSPHAQSPPVPVPGSAPQQAGSATPPGPDYQPRHPTPMLPHQDPLYPGFPQNEKGELVPPPPTSRLRTGEDLPRDMNVLRFFFNLGVMAYSCPMWPPVSYLAPLHQAYTMQPKAPPQPANPYLPTGFQEGGAPMSSGSDGLLPQEPPGHASLGPSKMGSALAPPFEPQGRLHAVAPPAELPGVGGYNTNVQTTTVQMPPHPGGVVSRPAFHQVIYPAGPAPTPPYPPPASCPAPPYPPTSVGYQRLPSAYHLPPEALRHSPHTTQDFPAGVTMTMVAPGMDGGGQTDGPRSVTPLRFGGDCSHGDVAVALTSVELQAGGHGHFVHGVANGKRRDPDVTKTYPGSSHTGVLMGTMIPTCSPVDVWGSEEEVFQDADLRNTRSYYRKSYRAGGRRGQDDMRGTRGRSSRARRDYGQQVRHGEQQSSYSRAYNGRGRAPSFYPGSDMSYIGGPLM